MFQAVMAEKQERKYIQSKYKRRASKHKPDH